MPKTSRVLKKIEVDADLAQNARFNSVNTELLNTCPRRASIQDHAKIRTEDFTTGYLSRLTKDIKPREEERHVLDKNLTTSPMKESKRSLNLSKVKSSVENLLIHSPQQVRNELQTLLD